MRWCAILVIALSAGASSAHAQDAEKLFRQMEKKLQSAKTIKVVFEAELKVADQKTTLKGGCTMGEGNLLRLEAEGNVFGKDLKATAVSNGKTLAIKKTGEVVIETRDVEAGFGAFLRTGLARSGILGGVEGGTRGKLPNAEDRFKIADFKLGAKEQINGRDVQAVEYTLDFNNDPFATTVYIDVKTHLPVKLSLRKGDGAVEVTETYSEFTIDVAVDPKLFDLPK